jgi:hypothetical protein
VEVVVGFIDQDQRPRIPRVRRRRNGGPEGGVRHLLRRRPSRRDRREPYHEETWRTLNLSTGFRLAGTRS